MINVIVTADHTKMSSFQARYKMWYRVPDGHPAAVDLPVFDIDRSMALQLSVWGLRYAVIDDFIPFTHPKIKKFIYKKEKMVQDLHMPKGYVKVFSMSEREKISGQFREFRRDQLLNQADLAELLGVTGQTVSNIERGVGEPHKSTYLKFLELREIYGRGRWPREA